jgi:hypothetical protein
MVVGSREHNTVLRHTKIKQSPAQYSWGLVRTSNPRRGRGYAIYDVTVDGGSITGGVSSNGIYRLARLPHNATLTKVWYKVITAFNCAAGNSRIYIGDFDDLDSILATTDYDDAAFAVGFHDTIIDGTTANFRTIPTADRGTIHIRPITEDLTAGKLHIWWEWVVTD